MPNKPKSNALACPLCGAKRNPDFRPFCSRGCRDRDLNRWFDEDYRMAADEPPQPLSPGDDGS